MSRMYCLTCFYDLRGLPDHRCPECGRTFTPSRPSSYSSTPRPERLHKLVKHASTLLGEALTAIEPTDPVARSLAALRRQVSRLSVENWDLQRQVTALTRVLLDRGLIDADELAAVNAGAAADVEIIDDTEPPATPDEADDPATPELLELRRAVDGHAFGTETGDGPSDPSNAS